VSTTAEPFRRPFPSPSPPAYRPARQDAAGGLFVTARQVRAAAGLAAHATITDAAWVLVAGYRLSFIVAVDSIAAAAAIVLSQLRRATAGPRPAVPGRTRGDATRLSRRTA
jgi:hypothetical protein